MKDHRLMGKISWIVLFTLLVCACLAPAAPAAANTQLPIGVIDYGYLLNNHPDTAKANEILKAEQESARKEFAAKSAGMNDADKQALDRQLGQRVELKRQELLKPIADSIAAAMKAVADAKGLAMVVYKNGVALGGIEITEDVLKRIGGK
jgi:outer membrane protein